MCWNKRKHTHLAMWQPTYSRLLCTEVVQKKKKKNHSGSKSYKYLNLFSSRAEIKNQKHENDMKKETLEPKMT